MNEQLPITNALGTSTARRQSPTAAPEEWERRVRGRGVGPIRLLVLGIVNPCRDRVPTDEGLFQTGS